MSYTVCQSDFQTDRDQILDLWRENLPTSSVDRYSWLYGEGASPGWLVKSGEETTVGSIGLMERKIKVFDEILRAGHPIDLNIDEHHRTVGPALGLQRALTATVQDGQRSLLYGFPNDKSELIQRRAGFRCLGTLGRWAKPLVVGKSLAAKVRNPLALRAAGVIASPAMRLVSPETFYRRRSGIQVDVGERFDERFDAFWETAADRFPIVGERTSKYLAWRFGKCPDAAFRVLCVSNAEDELLAYLVYQERENKFYVGDFLFAEPRHLDILLAEFLRLARKEKVEAVIAVYLGSQFVCRRLKHFGFWQRPCDWKAMLYVEKESTVPAGPLFETENWHLTYADIDTND